jgi:hypothetical protein
MQSSVWSSAGKSRSAIQGAQAFFRHSGRGAPSQVTNGNTATQLKASYGVIKGSAAPVATAGSVILKGSLIETIAGIKNPSQLRTRFTASKSPSLRASGDAVFPVPPPVVFGKGARSGRKVRSAAKLSLRLFIGILFAFVLVAVSPASLQSQAPEKKATWKPVQFAILRFNDDAPKEWNIYHAEKRGVLLVHLWKRYMLVNVQDQEVYEVDPQKVKIEGENADWSPSDISDQPVETSEWKVRDVGPMERIRFRFGKTGHFLDIQIPLLINGKPAY